VKILKFAEKSGIVLGVMILLIISMSGCLGTAPHGIEAGTEDKYSLIAPNGLTFEEIRGYGDMHIVATKYRTDKDELRYVLGNDVAIESYSEGAGQSGKPFRDGTILVKIGWTVKNNPDWDTAVEQDVLQRVEYQIKDSEKYKDSGGWMWARFVYDAETDTFKPFGENEKFFEECFNCHGLVEGKDYVFTDYAVR
jgi:hypothetical protein